MAGKLTLMKHSRSKIMTNIPQDEVVYAMKELSQGAYRLLVYHYSKLDGWVFHDKKTAEDIDVPNERAVKKYRKELIDKKYLAIRGKNPILYLIGKKIVMDFEDNEFKGFEQ